MKLGIVVVYLVSEENEKLLDLHLGQIEKNTTVPYTIYGSINRLLPRLRRRLEQHPKVKICECPTTDFRGLEEHSYYLEHLVRIAIEDGASHIVTLHVDSFPISSGWAEILARKLSESCAFATIERINTACLFFHRDFYIKYSPRFLLSEDEQTCSKYNQYLREFDPIYHSGIGYGFKAYAEGLSWYYLRESSKRESPYALGSIYDGLIFHLMAAFRLTAEPPRIPSFLGRKSYIRFLELMLTIIPPQLRCLLRTYLNTPMEYLVDSPIHKWQLEQLEYVRQQLLEDPQSYLDCLRSGTR